MWSDGVITQDWKKGIILPIYKGKGSRRDCKNYRWITLLSCPWKLFAHILLERVKDILIAARRKEQSGFAPHRSTVDQISAKGLAGATSGGEVLSDMDYADRVPLPA